MRKFLAFFLSLLPSIAWAASAYETYVSSTFTPTTFYYGSESSGNIINHGSGGSGYDLTAGTAPTYSQAGVNSGRGNSLLFASASSQFMHVNKNDTGSGPGDISTSNGRTFECWINPSALGAGISPFSTGTDESGAATGRVWVLQKNSSNKVEFFIANNTTGAAYSDQAGATSLSSGVWYLITGTWAGSATRNTVYLNGVQDGQTTTASGTANGGVQWWEMGRFGGSLSAYMNGNVQDCASYGVESTASSVLARYNFGVASGTVVWPFLTRAPRLPDFRNPGYLDKVRDRGYLTGHYTNKALEPQWLTVGYLPFATLPRGDAR